MVPPSAPRAASSTRDCTVPAAETLVQHADAAFTSPVLWKAVSEELQLRIRSCSMALFVLPPPICLHYMIISSTHLQAPAQPRARSSPPVQRRHQYEAATRQPPSLLDELDISPTEYIGDLF